MRQIRLATVLVIAPIGVFALGEAYLIPATPSAHPLGDLSGFGVIVTDVAMLADAGDLAGAKARIADLETAWDDREGTLRPVNPDAWGAMSMRASTPPCGQRGPHHPIRPM